MIIISEISIACAGVLLFLSLIQYMGSRGWIRRAGYVLDCAIYAMEQEQIYQEKQRVLKEQEDRVQKNRVFYQDFRISHGSAFGGFCATMNDGRHKKGTVSLDQILLYGKHPTGKEFTYYIEEQNIEIGAMDDPDLLFIRSTDDSKFEIRQKGQGRDEGEEMDYAVLRKGITYYIILESKHEISIRGMKMC